MPRREITAAEIMPMEAYTRIRRQRRTEMSIVKRNRRVEVGPFATFYFESYETMLHQVHEMLAIERGGDAQLPDELEAYNPLVPQGSELVATVMFEIDDPVRRKTVLGRLGGVEEAMFVEVGGERVMSRAEADADRTTAEGKASSVQFVHFDLTPAQVIAFKRQSTKVMIGVDHPAYGHVAVLPETTRAALAGDLD